MITRLAIGALPPSALRRFAASNSAALQEYSVIPDTRLKALYGEAEKRRHYINLEYFGRDPYRSLAPSLDEMERRYGIRLIQRAGTLPWTIEQVSEGIGRAWKNGNCPRVIVLSGYLSHYVGDLSQPLHTTVHFDGPTPRDRGMHARFELAVDRRTRSIEVQARPDVRVQPIASVWDAVIDGLRASNALVPEVVSADRAAHAVAGADEPAYEAALMQREQASVARRISDAASRLASIWKYEWDQAGRPTSCAATVE